MPWAQVSRPDPEERLELESGSIWARAAVKERVAARSSRPPSVPGDVRLGSGDAAAVAAAFSRVIWGEETRARTLRLPGRAWAVRGAGGVPRACPTRPAGSTPRHPAQMQRRTHVSRAGPYNSDSLAVLLLMAIFPPPGLEAVG